MNVLGWRIEDPTTRRGKRLGPRVVFTIDGARLKGDEETDDGAIWSGLHSDLAHARIRQLEEPAEPDFPDQRFLVEGCFCGEPMDGGMSAEIVRDGDNVEWREVAEVDITDEDPLAYVGAPTFAFAAEQYALVFAQLRALAEDYRVERTRGRWRGTFTEVVVEFDLPTLRQPSSREP